MFGYWRRRAGEAITLAESLEAAIEGLQKERDKLLKERDELREERGPLTTQISNLQQERDSARDARKAADQRVEDAETEIRELHKEREEHLKRISCLADAGEELRKRAEAAEAEVAALEDCRKHLLRLGEIAGCGSIATAEDRSDLVDEVETELQGWGTRTQRAETELAELRGRLDKAANFLAGLRDTLGGGNGEPSLLESIAVPVSADPPEPAEAACDGEEAEPFDADEESKVSVPLSYVPLSYETFMVQVCKAGLGARDCGNGHWQAKGDRLVNYWPFARRGPKIYVDGQRRGQTGSLAEVIALAKGKDDGKAS
jgi:prefoldin subunit 5